jgi:hypothetical protein
MTEDQVKEALSNNYVATLANRKGFKLIKGYIDTGVDFTIKYDMIRTLPNGEIRHSESPYSCDIQLKATTISSIIDDRLWLKYDLNAKNYNDLIFRKQLGSTPLILILFILPDDENDWVKILRNKLILSKNAYWYYPNHSEINQVKNSGTKRIKISKRNKLGFDFFENQIKTWIPEWKSTN